MVNKTHYPSIGRMVDRPAFGGGTEAAGTADEKGRGTSSTFGVRTFLGQGEGTGNGFGYSSGGGNGTGYGLGAGADNGIGSG